HVCLLPRYSRHSGVISTYTCLLGGISGEAPLFGADKHACVLIAAIQQTFWSHKHVYVLIRCN
ncbi:hypothetical protein, partial [Paenibacillus sp. FSL H8-0548]|uniref:hypothetical protein n=1 Tax=Paenibacillus sp. FSL H8-0548 TaxID=1920422 RepID=UPI001C4DD53A